MGNHAIAAIEIPKDYSSPKLRSVVTLKSGHRYLIFDPTWEKTAFGQLENNLQGSYGELVDGQNSEIVQLPVLSPELNMVNRSATFELRPDGSIAGSIVEKRFGDLSEYDRSLYTEADVKEQQRELARTLSRDFLAFEVSGFKVENAAALNKDLTTSFHLSAARYGRTPGSLLMIRPRILGSESFAIDRQSRTISIDLSETMQANDNFTIELPPATPSTRCRNPSNLTLVLPPTKAKASFPETRSTTPGPTPSGRSPCPPTAIKTSRNWPPSSTPTKKPSCLQKEMIQPLCPHSQPTELHTFASPASLERDPAA